MEGNDDMSEKITYDVDSVRTLGKSLRLVRYGDTCVLDVCGVDGTWCPEGTLHLDTFRDLVRAISDLGGDEIAELLGASIDARY